MLLKTTSLTIKQALNQAILKLKRFHIPEAFLDAQIILAFILKKDRSFILAHDEKILTAKQYKNYQALINKRVNHWPIAYLTGEKEFCGYKFKVNKHVLIPRPDSELIIDEVLPLLNNKSILIDLGTGSGCLIISVLLQNKNIKQAIAIDVSNKVLKVTTQNAKNYKLDKKIKFVKSNLLAKIDFKKFPKNSDIIIMANLPYLTPQQMLEPTIKHEPKLALVAGNDGLKYYRTLAKQLKNSHIRNITLICEINPKQKAKFKKIFPKTEFRKDLSGKIRLGIIKT